LRGSGPGDLEPAFVVDWLADQGSGRGTGVLSWCAGGASGEALPIFKFRTMVVDAEKIGA